jgi:hypothetical protein
MKEYILRLARMAIENYVKYGKVIDVPRNYPKELGEKKGVFVTIYKKGTKELRGCIGFPYPQLPLVRGIIEASVSACKDPRFKPLREEELEGIFIEVSVLTEPELIEVNNPKEYLEKIEIGKHGLIIENGVFSGLLLPKVPIELGWSVEEYLENLCFKAGLTPDSWADPNSKIYKFEADVFTEDF